jgi:hypothetical protein
MKTTKRYLVNPTKIHSLQDLSMEKQRLRYEILKTEENIHSGYRDLVHALTFKNIALSVVSDISASSSLLTKAIAIGKSFMSKRKKKKNDRLEASADETGS